MLKNLCILSLLFLIMGSAFDGSYIKPSEYSHFKCLRGNRTYKGGLVDAVKKCEKVIKEVE